MLMVTGVGVPMVKSAVRSTSCRRSSWSRGIRNGLSKSVGMSWSRDQMARTVRYWWGSSVIDSPDLTASRVCQSSVRPSRVTGALAWTQVPYRLGERSRRKGSSIWVVVAEGGAGFRNIHGTLVMVSMGRRFPRTVLRAGGAVARRTGVARFERGVAALKTMSGPGRMMGGRSASLSRTDPGRAVGARDGVRGCQSRMVAPFRRNV